MTESESVLDRLRKPFEPSSVGKLPRITCRKCSNASGRVCDEHTKNRCNECQNYITSAHLHLDYVGHAEVTDRLLSVDPCWTWEPFGLDVEGLPAVDKDEEDRPIGLWIRLTVGGVTRIGYGSVEKGTADAVKQLIGDAIRNAAMRFGVALDLWAKSELESATLTADGQHDAGGRRQRPTGARSSGGGGGEAPNGEAPTTGADPGAPCSLCGSTRAQRVDVRGVWRCAAATDCKRRQEERDQQPPPASQDAPAAPEEVLGYRRASPAPGGAEGATGDGPGEADQEALL